jgi:signal transduction histidine kinase
LVGEKESNISLTKRSTLIEMIRKLDGPIIRDEIEKRFPPYLAERLLAEMSDLDAEVVFCMLFKDDLIGLIGIGRKLSGDAYFTEDLEILNLIADETAIAVRNAQLYQQVASLELERNRVQQLALIGTLAATLTHELKNHLVPVRTFVELLPEQLTDPEFQNFSRIAIEGIDHMTNRISEFQNLADSTPPKLSPVDPINALEDILLLMSAQLMKQRIEVVRVYAPDLPRVKVDASQLKQVLLNLLLNSSEAMEGPGEIRLEGFVVPRAFIHQGEPFAPFPSPPPPLPKLWERGWG